MGGWVGVWCVCVLVYVGVRGYMYVHVWEGGGLMLSNEEKP